MENGSVAVASSGRPVFEKPIKAAQKVVNCIKPGAAADTQFSYYIVTTVESVAIGYLYRCSHNFSIKTSAENLRMAVIAPFSTI